ncbi:TetR/AcrR family transcriptional regulator [Ruminiclostridium cellobioparum]|uniref:Transcriptional regulator n=1 Tax=Ruminiclostridium cellobioparum subsp. termitidis CT1112 TaxID=1195236 RepID=S0FU18_RUMCE|nr:TetR/AcrR family transcriptional regulator [Ruminiclostridium cellobioparum]EMS72674.1 Transcriptional regulator [Ruminiclostridium cellobioparum subsp. termitidis CT1112]
MIKDKNDTKNRILQVSLDLFSLRGYSSVSIRDICGKVGIKESSVYHHFKSKQDIFDVLCNSFTETLYALPQAFSVEMQKVTSVKDEEFIFVCQSFVNDYLMNEKINKFIRMLIIEQGTNVQAAELYHRVLFDDALAGQKVIYQWLVNIGFLRNSDVDMMVMEYYSHVIYLFHRYLAAGEITAGIRAEVNRSLLRHIQNFLAKYKKVD